MPHQCTNCDRTFDDGSTEMLSGCPDCGGTKFQFRPDGFGDSADDSESAQSQPSDPEPAQSDPPEPPERPGDGMTRAVGNAAATVKDLVSGRTSPDAAQATPPSTSDAATQAESGDDDIIVAESEPVSAEDTAQADARTAVVGPDEMPDSDGFDPATGTESGDDAESDDGSTVESIADDVDVVDPAAADAVDTGSNDATHDAPEAETDDEEPSPDADSDRTVVDEPDAERADRPSLAELREELNEQFESIRVVEPGQYELNLMELYDREEYIIALQEDGRYSIQVPESWREADA